MLIGALGLVVTGLGQAAGAAWTGVGTALFVIATIVAWRGARLFAGHSARLGVVGALSAIWLASIPLQSDPTVWLGIACLTGAGFILASALELWRARAEKLASRTVTTIVLLIHVVVYGVRGLVALAGDVGPRWAEPVMIAMVVEALLHTMGMAFLIMSLMKERVEFRSSQLLRALALSDGLTGVGNRRRFDEQIETELRRARRLGTPLGLLLIDVDQFKSFNDNLGHPQGDICLREVAQAIDRIVRRPGDLTARYGGEEFAVLLIDTDLPGAIRVADEIRASVEDLAIVHPACGRVTVSIGAAVQSAHRREPAEALLRAADRALYEAKGAGRNRVMAAGPISAVHTSMKPSSAIAA